MSDAVAIGLAIMPCCAFLPAITVMGLRCNFSWGCSLALAWTVGTLISSYLLFVWSYFLFPASHAFFLAEAIVLGVLGFCFYKLARQIPPVERRCPAPRAPMLGWSLACVAVFAIPRYAMAVARKPNGGFDACAIWNLKARFLFRGNGDWTRLLSSDIAWSHPDYPLYVPLSAARLWSAFNTDTGVLSGLFHGLTTLAAIGIVVYAIKTIKGPRIAYTIGLILLIPIVAFRIAAMQSADMCLANFVVAAVALTTLLDFRKVRHVLPWILVGILVGGAAWTKNEGLLFVLAFVLARMLFNLLWCDDRQVALRCHAWAAIGAALSLIIPLLYKFGIAPTNPIVAFDQRPVFQLVTDVSRHATILLWFGKYMLFNLIWLVPYLWFAGVRVRASSEAARQFGWIFALVVIVYSGYYAVYLITPYNLAWHLETSLRRLVLHYCPTMLFAVVVICPNSIRLPRAVRAAARMTQRIGVVRPRSGHNPAG